MLTGRIPLGPGGLRLAEHGIGVLRRAGFGNREASYGHVILVFYAIGFATQELAFGQRPRSTNG